MGWLSKWVGWGRRDAGDHARSNFAPIEWARHLERLTDEERRSFALNVCRRVLERTGLHGEDVASAMAAIACGEADPDLISRIQALVERYDGEYDCLVGEDESKLLCTDPEIEAVFLKSTAATVLRCALEEDLTGMAYYGWCVLEDLDEIRRLAGMPKGRG